MARQPQFRGRAWADMVEDSNDSWSIPKPLPVDESSGMGYAAGLKELEHSKEGVNLAFKLQNKITSSQGYRKDGGGDGEHAVPRPKGPTDFSHLLDEVPAGAAGSAAGAASAAVGSEPSAVDADANAQMEKKEEEPSAAPMDAEGQESSHPAAAAAAVPSAPAQQQDDEQDVEHMPGTYEDHFPTLAGPGPGPGPSAAGPHKPTHGHGHGHAHQQQQHHGRPMFKKASQKARKHVGRREDELEGFGLPDEGQDVRMDARGEGLEGGDGGRGRGDGHSKPLRSILEQQDKGKGDDHAKREASDSASQFSEDVKPQTKRTKHHVGQSRFFHQPHHRDPKTQAILDQYHKNPGQFAPGGGGGGRGRGGGRGGPRPHKAPTTPSLADFLPQSLDEHEKPPPPLSLPPHRNGPHTHTHVQMPIRPIMPAEMGWRPLPPQVVQPMQPVMMVGGGGYGGPGLHSPLPMPMPMQVRAYSPPMQMGGGVGGVESRSPPSAPMGQGNGIASPGQGGGQEGGQQGQGEGDGKEEERPKTEEELKEIQKRITSRQKQINIGKGTQGYQNYRKLVKREHRTAVDPMTPDPKRAESKREFDGKLREWRKALHNYDNVKLDDDEEDAASNPPPAAPAAAGSMSASPVSPPAADVAGGAEE
ncbi:unnamed protein product [Vitrella brassicaformis CCMP3155]|uniref:Histone RNA hairpin-binding protein RNA-binding domain-containing protein n=2 Tax=Vitrella brassicaformis TaxID=1169539 RepID=A0A0G4EQ16_VITBC|nr:unnamed protein product [Vitrella brassicaformis CCMP3155]|eukprot:CEL99492.1 unnamed protein product [Vitrella brassicaformis CCMP3155]